MNFTKVFWTNSTLEINRKLVFGEVRKLFSRVVKREKWDIMLSWCVAITIFCIVCFETVAHGIDSLSNNRFDC